MIAMITRHTAMVRLPVFILLTFSISLIAYASPLEHAQRFTQTSANLEDTSIRYVNDSGICETTPGVQQMSGYIDVGTNMNMVVDWNWSICSMFI